MNKETSEQAENVCSIPGCDIHGLIIFDASNFTIVAANKRAGDLLGCAFDTFPGNSLLHLGFFSETEVERAVACCREGHHFYSSPLLPASSPSATSLAVFTPLPQAGRFLVSVAIILEGREKAFLDSAARFTVLRQPLLSLFDAFENGIFDFLSDAAALLDADGYIRRINLAFSFVTGFDIGKIEGKGLEALVADDSGELVADHIRAELTERGFWEGELPCRKNDGELFTSRLHIRCVTPSDQDSDALLLLQRESLKPGLSGYESYRTQIDPLTGLPNRLLFFDRLSQAIRNAIREKRWAALLFIDLDRFKWINDTFGHLIGDELLQDVATRLSHCVRQSDTVSRLGGDEFTVILTGLSSASFSETVAQSILAQMAAPFVVGHQEIHMSCSIGISIFPEDGSIAETLLKNADAAMYKAKQKGRNRYQFFTQDLNDELEERSELADELKQALVQQQLYLYYQPIVNLQTGRVVKAEALLRWQHDSMGWVQPEKVVRLAESSGLTQKLGKWALLTACRESRNFLYGTVTPLPISVNTSSRFFRQSDFLATVQSAMTETGILAGALTLEVREKLFLEDFARLQDTVEGLHGMGARLCIDDFGTDYASLTSLAKHSLEALKIDGSLIRKCVENTGERVVEAIVAMAHRLGVPVVAEGVETEKQFQFLRSIGCDQAQGFFFCRPLPANDFISYLGDHIFAF